MQRVVSRHGVDIDGASRLRLDTFFLFSKRCRVRTKFFPLMLIILPVLAFGLWKSDDVAHVPAGYVTKVTCSEVFVAGRAPADVATANFQNISPTFDWVSIDVDDAAKTVRGHFVKPI